MYYQDYLDAIKERYEQKKANNELSSKLLNPTPSRLRDECAFVYQSRLVRKDLKMLASFFEVHDGSDILKAIEGIDIDKFRPLVNFLKEATEKTDDKNIELLGWLLDFEPRPYDDRYDYKKGAVFTTEKIPAGPPEDPTNEQADGKAGNPIQLPITAIQPGPVGTEQIGPKRPALIKKLGFIAGSLVIASGLIAAVIFNNKDNKNCMIWAGDHYERVSCDSSGGMGLVLGLDANSVRHLRRITRPDTLTEKDIGKVWYRKRGSDSLDFYTTGGRDPIDPNLDLKRLTVYIFEKYLRKKSSTDSSGVR